MRRATPKKVTKTLRKIRAEGIFLFIIPSKIGTNIIAVPSSRAADDEETVRRPNISKDIIAKKTVRKAPAAPVKMQDYDHRDAVEWQGKQYTVSISRRADTSLPMITDDIGNKYYDNKITVRVTRPDGTVFFDKTFGKTDFSSVISEKYMKKSALLGIVVDPSANSRLVLAASVGAPDVLSDDYVPLLITLSRMGNISIEKDTRAELEVEE